MKDVQIYILMTGLLKKMRCDQHRTDRQIEIKISISKG